MTKVNMFGFLFSVAAMLGILAFGYFVTDGERCLFAIIALTALEALVRDGSRFLPYPKRLMLGAKMVWPKQGVFTIFIASSVVAIVALADMIVFSTEERHVSSLVGLIACLIAYFCCMALGKFRW